MPITTSGMMQCPTCHGSTWDPRTDKDCGVCGATGAVTTEGERVSYEDASRFINWLNETKRRRLGV